MMENILSSIHEHMRWCFVLFRHENFFVRCEETLVSSFFDDFLLKKEKFIVVEIQYLKTFEAGSRRKTARRVT